MARWYKKGAVAAIRAWRLAALVAAVGACLRRRRALRRWFANAGVHKATRLREEEEAARAELERLEEAARVQAERLEEEARVEAERAEHKKNLGDYADAVLAASSPALRNARKLATLHKSLSTWRIALIRSQRARLDDLAGTCDDLARAAENAAAAAAGVEHRNTELGDAAEALRERIIVAEQRAEEFERAASVESAERKAMEEELERQRDRASRAEERAAGAAPPRRWRPEARRLPRRRRRARRRRGARRRRWVSARSSPRRRRCRSGPRRLSGRRLELRDRRGKGDSSDRERQGPALGARRRGCPRRSSRSSRRRSAPRSNPRTPCRRPIPSRFCAGWTARRG